MTVVDFLIILFCVFFTIQGLWRGFVRELFGLLALLTGIAAAINFYNLPSDFLKGFFSEPTNIKVAGFIVVFLAVWITITLMGYVLSKRLEEAGKSLVSRLAGGLVALGKIILVISAVVYFAEQTFPGNPITTRGKICPTCIEIATWARQYFPFLFKPAQNDPDIG